MEILNRVSDYFEFAKHKTSFKTEILAGLSTFLTLSYIFVVNPSILSAAGMDKSMVLFATVIASFAATFLMGLWARKPFALAPGMEMNAYVAFFVILGLGFSWQQALGAVFWSGVIFMVLTLTGVREKIIKAIPDKMKSGLALSIGAFLMIIALKLAGIIVYDGVYFQGIAILFSPSAYVLYFGLAAVLVLKKLKVPGAVLISIALASVFAGFFGLENAAEQFVISSGMLQGLFQLDFLVILNPKIIAVVLVLFLIDFYGSVAKFIGLTRKTSIMNKDGSMPKMKEALSVDGIGTLIGSVLGTTSITTYVESGVGIAEGGRTGLTAITCALLMLLALELAPLFNLIPLIATTGALFWVGLTLIPSWEELKAYSRTDIASVIAMVGTTLLTFSVDKAILLGFLVYIIGLIASRKFKELDLYMIASTIALGIGVALSL